MSMTWVKMMRGGIKSFSDVGDEWDDGEFIKTAFSEERHRSALSDV